MFRLECGRWWNADVLAVFLSSLTTVHYLRNFPISYSIMRGQYEFWLFFKTGFIGKLGLSKSKDDKLLSFHCAHPYPCFIFVCALCLQNSLTRSAPLNSEAQGRSGARFHTSYDKRYVIKTISSEDVAEMHNILKKYHQVKRAFLTIMYDLLFILP